MYRTIEETALYLQMPEEQVRRYILERRIKAVYDGEQFVINDEQFNRHFDQLDELKAMIEEWRNTPIPEDPDIKDED